MEITATIDETKYGLLCRCEEVPTVMRELSALYNLIWVEAAYDPRNPATEAYANRLLPHIQAINAIVRFKK